VRSIAILLVALFAAQAQDAHRYARKLPKETEEQKEERHLRVSQRRGKIPIMVHRGAAKFAPENTLEAYAAAIDQGADGCEIDIRKSKDGVFYLFHDGKRDRMLQGSGSLKDLTYDEIAKIPFRHPYGTATKKTRVPTLESFLVLAKQRAMLIHLDVKQKGLEEDLKKLFEEADMWDHIVEITWGNAQELRKHPKVKLMYYKGFHPRNAGDIQEFVRRPGQMTFIKADPTPLVEVLRRKKPEKPVPIPKEAYEQSEGDQK
jgi:glycerophosphoryl diester phosphodiesterase